MSAKKTIVFRINDHGQGPELVREIFTERGWVEFNEDNPDGQDWNIWWRTAKFRTCDHDDMMSWQRLNHFPKSTAITKKDSLARCVRRMKAVHGNNSYNFFPDAFNLPNDYTKFVAEYSKTSPNDRGSSNSYWICKPADMSRGRGIFIFKKLSDLHYDCSAVVQKYISQPLLIAGYKFDIRLYVAVPSFHPLTIYIYQEGLVRFGTEKYDLENLDNVYAHLTNTSINIHSPTYAVDKERIGLGCKWTLTQLRQYFRQANLDDQMMFNKIINIVIMTLVIQAQIQQNQKVTNCCELYGFDILIDENLKPRLLEVNFSPALSSDCETDIIVKKPMLHDLLDMMKFTPADIERGNGKNISSSKSLSGIHSGRTSSFSWNRNKNRKLPNIHSSGMSTRRTVPEDSGDDSDREVVLDSHMANKEADNSMCYGLPLVHPRDDDISSENEYSCDDDDEPARQLTNTKPLGKSQSSSSLNKLTLGKSQSSSSLNKLPFLSKMHKDSVQSDSGISCYSGSSDSSDIMSITEERSIVSKQSIKNNTCKLPEMKGSVMMVNTPVSKTNSNSTRQRHSKVKSDTKVVSKSTGKLKMHGFSSRKSTIKSRYASGVPKPSSAISRRSKEPDSKIGDFYLVFPENGYSGRRNSSSLDVKAIIKDCQKRLKQVSDGSVHKLNDDSHSFSSPSTSDKLWCSLKHFEEQVH